MELLIFSDSHGKEEGIRCALQRQPRLPQAICFLGDGIDDVENTLPKRSMLYSVRGNCDWGARFSEFPTERLIELEGHRLLLTHGHMFGVKGGVGALISHAVECQADIVLFGHTHRPQSAVITKETRVGNRVLSAPMYLFNPGSIAYDEDGDGRSFGTLLLTRDTVLFSHGRI